MNISEIKAKLPEWVELDKQRTQGEWYNSDGVIWYQEADTDGNGNFYPVQVQLAQAYNNDADFIAQAPAIFQALQVAMGRVEELEKANEWQPIETAPKNGSSFMATWEYNKKRYYKTAWTHQYTNGVWGVVTEHITAKESDDGEDGYVAPPATHWQPLNPPTHEAQDDK